MIEGLMDRWGDDWVLLLGGFTVGLLFGASAQRSRFCLRAATVEFAEGQAGPRLAVWLLVFSGAVVAVQVAVLAGLVRPEDTRQIGAVGSLSGAVIGGLMFGAGMILARGCASRLLILSATGNLRALITGLVLTIVAQASLRGILSTPREALSGLWTVPGGEARDLLALLGLETGAAVLAGFLLMAVAVWLGWHRGIGMRTGIAAVGVGLAVALGWVFTFAAAEVSFTPLTPSSVTFTGPSADTLMALVNSPLPELTFGTGLVPGVFIGALIASLLGGDFQLQGFESGASMLRYLAGATLMGFGAMLAGGCAVGAGVSGGSLLAVTSWLALFSMWVGAMSVHRLDLIAIRRALPA